MNEEEKKAVEFINDLIAWNVGLYPDREECEKLETILSLIEKLQKENDELNVKILSNAGIYQLGFKDGEESYIQTVKDSIEEILNNKEYRIVFEGNAEFPDDATIINAQKYIKLEKMQELIEERE